MELERERKGPARSVRAYGRAAARFRNGQIPKCISICLIQPKIEIHGGLEYGSKINWSLEGQLDLLQSLKDNNYYIVAIQKPHIDFLGRTRANIHWTVVHPKRHLDNPSKTRAIILIN